MPILSNSSLQALSKQICDNALRNRRLNLRKDDHRLSVLMSTNGRYVTTDTDMDSAHYPRASLPQRNGGRMVQVQAFPASTIVSI